ncbi:hypothetical protein [Bosea sp. (in: a-proteobacteria)]|jgi:hypothetical protein|nr:hypothetical protein [Bosea sp. (in: a-proteobacteria)]HEV2510780.1 hypothetical protein [Bosea sp. (in: a-proteobacteria)]
MEGRVWDADLVGIQHRDWLSGAEHICVTIAAQVEKAKLAARSLET